MTRTVASLIPVNLDTIDARIEELERLVTKKRTTGKWHGFIKQRLRYLRDKREEQLELWITLTINCENY
jgi:hypothetical protein